MNISRLISAIIFIFLVPVASAALNYEERNTINSGDNSFNVIAVENSNVVIALNAQGQFSEFSYNSVAKFVRNDSPEVFDKAVKEYPNQSLEFLEAVAIGQFFFKNKQYTSSALMFERALSLIDEEEGGKQLLEGLTTASYYGSARHIEGLKFICRQYQSRPKWSYEFRHAIHAHLRSLAKNISLEHARKSLEFVRQDPACRRADFTPVWIPIHLKDMRWLEQSTEAKSANYGISNEEDLQFAKKILKEGNHGFLDYLYFILGDYDKIVKDFPDSYLIDLTLLALGEQENYEVAKFALLKYAEKFPENEMEAITRLYMRARYAKDRETTIWILDNFETERYTPTKNAATVFKINNHIRVIFEKGEVLQLSVKAMEYFSSFYSECQRIEHRIYEGHFSEVISWAEKYLSEYSQHFDREHEIAGYFGNPGDKNYLGKCLIELRPSKLKALESFLTPFAEIAVRNNAMELAKLEKI